MDNNEREERRKQLMARLEAASKEVTKGGTKAEGAYRVAYQNLVVEGFMPQLRKKYR